MAIWHYYYYESNESNRIQARNRIEGRNRMIFPIQRLQPIERSKRSGRVFNCIIQEEYSKKEKREIYCLLSCYTRIGNLLMPYPWMGNSRERRGRYAVIIIIRTVTIGQCIIHHTRHRILILISSRMDNHEWSLHCHACAKSSMSTWHHHIEFSKASPNRTFMLGIIL